MRAIVSIVFLVALVFVQGCSTIGPVSREHVEIFRDGEKPDRPFQEIRLFTDDGALGEQGAIEARMIRQAQQIGADALLFEKVTKTGEGLHGFGIVDFYLFKARAVVYK